MEHSTVCRICVAGCGVLARVDEGGSLVGVRGDRGHPLSHGHACFKGLQAPQTHNSPNRILTALKRDDAGGFARIPVEDALDEIADKLEQIRDAFGPEAIATYSGGASFYNFTAGPMMAAFRTALGTQSHYTTATIDQPGKRVAAERMGYWQAGKIGVDQADVLMLVGTNPMVSFQTVGCFANDPVKALKRARARGMKLIVIDPRLTETARQADVFIQALPGEDVTVLACFLREILDRGLADAAFCAQHVAPGHVERLRAAVSPFTLDYAARRARVDPAALIAGVELLCRIPIGSVFSGTGPSMGPQSSLAEQMVECINALGGRYRREGDVIPNIVPWQPYVERHAQAVSPTRAWEQLAPSRFRGVDVLRGERLTSNLPAAILEPGKDHVRALLNDGGNIAGLVPDQGKIVDALRDLDLLVSIDPFMNGTSRLSHYIFGPKLQYERDDMPMTHPTASFLSRSWAQYLPAIVQPPAGSHVVDDHYVFWGLAKRLGLPLEYCGVPLDMESPPSTEQLIELGAAGGVVSLDEIRRYPFRGQLFPVEQTVKAAKGDAGRFELMPDDAAGELAQIWAEWKDGGFSRENDRFTHRLAVRRTKEMFNNQGLYIDSVRARAPYNPVYMTGDDIRQLGLREGDRVMVISAHARVEAVLERDDTPMTGVVTLAHGWGGLPGDENEFDLVGACANRLLDGDEGIDRHTALAVMTGVPVYLERIAT